MGKSPNPLPFSGGFRPEIKNPPANAGDARNVGSIPGSGKIPWRRKWQPTPVFFPGKSHPLSMGSQRVVMTEHTHTHTHTHFRSQAQEGSSHSRVPHPCLASHLELPELPCAGATPEVTAKLLILYCSQDFPPSKPHLGTQARVCDELRLWYFSC